nr:hypothetical protein CFP56_22938 [Quercus suber]
MSFNSFSGLLPMSLLNLPNLSTLYLGYNQLVGPLPNHAEEEASLNTHFFVILIHSLLLHFLNNGDNTKSTFFHGPRRHRAPFFAKLVGIVAVEVIGSRSSPLQLTLRSCLESSCLEIKKTGSTLRDQKEIAIKEG